MKNLQDKRDEDEDHPPYKEDDKDYADTGRDYENDQSDDTGIPGYGVEGEPDDRTVDDDTVEE